MNTRTFAAGRILNLWNARRQLVSRSKTGQDVGYPQGQELGGRLSGPVTVNWALLWLPPWAVHLSSL